MKHACGIELENIVEAGCCYVSLTHRGRQNNKLLLSQSAGVGSKRVGAIFSGHYPSSQPIISCTIRQISQNHIIYMKENKKKSFIFYVTNHICIDEVFLI